jgi:hypothetical protein
MHKWRIVVALGLAVGPEIVRALADGSLSVQEVRAIVSAARAVLARK